MSILQAIDRSIRQVERVFTLVSNVMLFAIMVIVTVDVALRYLFASPLYWSYELVSLYLMVGLFFLSLSGTLRNHGHVAVDLLVAHMPPRLLHMTELVVYAASTVVFAMATYVTAISSYESYVAGHALMGAIAWPTWLSTIAVPMGMGVFTLRMGFLALGHGASLAAGRSVVPLPPAATRAKELSQ